MEKEIISVIKYFSFFGYQPTSQEIQTFLQAKISKNSLEKELDKMTKSKLIKYTPPQYSIKKVKNSELRIKNSKKKLENWRFRAYIKLLNFFSQIKLVGLSGSISMMNAEENDDIDLFIITAKNRLFTGRFISLILAQVIGLRRGREARSQNYLAPMGTLPAENGESQVAKNFDSSLLQSGHKDKVCLNLFFDESALQVPKFKQTEFVGHEVLQMKPIVVKSNIYERFLEANLWVFKLFPNAGEVLSMKHKVSSMKILNTRYYVLDTFFNKIESFLKKMQLFLIARHCTTEIITSTQLWFHPDDFEKKMQSRTTGPFE